VTYDLRRKIFQELANSGVTVYVADRIIQANSIFTPPKEKPFLVIRIGTTNPATPYQAGGVETYFQIWAHDDPGDYHVIDLVLAEVKKALLSAAREPGFYEFRYLETSEDMEDDAMSTLVRYCRYQAITREELPTPQP
jgi:hypothetical protein